MCEFSIFITMAFEEPGRGLNVNLNGWNIQYSTNILKLQMAHISKFELFKIGKQDLAWKNKKLAEKMCRQTLAPSFSSP